MWEGVITGMMVGIKTTLIPFNIAVVLFGCFVGSFIGMLPGLGPITAVALMIPVTYGLDPSSGMVLLAGVYYGAIFGGSTCSILINAPGEAATVAFLEFQRLDLVLGYVALDRPDPASWQR